MSSRVGALTAFAACLLGLAAPASGRTLQVDASATARGDGSRARPFQTIDAALLAARGGDRVEVAPGLYPRIRDERDHGSAVTVAPRVASRPPVISGALIVGAGHLTLSGLRFTGPILLGSKPTDRSRGAHHITIRDSKLTSRVPFMASCVVMRSGVSDITIATSVLEGCLYGVSGPGDGFADPSLQPITRRVTITGNLIQDMAADGLQFGHWEDVTISGNVIRRINDPRRVEHNDGIQVMGNSDDVRIVDNVIGDSTQLVFSQNAFGRNYRMTITGNLLLDGDAYSVQLSGTSDVRFANNTVWGSTYGVIFRDGTFGTWAANVIDRYVPGTSSRAMVDEGANVIHKRTAGTPHPLDYNGVQPLFADLAGGDLSLLPESPGHGAGAAAAATRGAAILSAGA